jgi:hypothetical protein
MYPRNSKVIPEDSKSIEHYTTSEMDPNRDNDFHVRRGIVCVHEPAPSFPKTPSPTSESTPKNGQEKNGRNGKGGKITTQVSRSFSFSSLETQSQ